MEMYEVIKKPIVTEKGTFISEKQNSYVFEVLKKANKLQIKAAVEGLFKVNVEDIKTMIVKGSAKRTGKYIDQRSNWKKAIVTLKKDQKIEIFEGV